MRDVGDKLGAEALGLHALAHGAVHAVGDGVEVLAVLLERAAQLGGIDLAVKLALGDALPGFKSCFIDSSAYSVASTRTARSMNQPKSCFPGLVPAMAIHRNSTKRIAAMMSTARGNMGMAFSPSLKV